MPLSEEVTKNSKYISFPPNLSCLILPVVAVALFGDPAHRNDSNVYGNATGNGIFYRAYSQTCADLGDRIRSYCDAGDPFCDVEGLPPSATAHLTYIQVHGEEVARYVVEQYNNGGQSGNGTDDDEASPSSTASSVPENAASGLAPMPVAVVLVSLAMLGFL